MKKRANATPRVKTRAKGIYAFFHGGEKRRKERKRKVCVHRLVVYMRYEYMFAFHRVLVNDKSAVHARHRVCSLVLVSFRRNHGAATRGATEKHTHTNTRVFWWNSRTAAVSVFYSTERKSVVREFVLCYAARVHAYTRRGEKKREEVLNGELHPFFLFFFWNSWSCCLPHTAIAVYYPKFEFLCFFLSFFLYDNFNRLFRKRNEYSIYALLSSCSARRARRAHTNTHTNTHTDIQGVSFISHIVISW